MILDKAGKDFIIKNEGIRYKAYLDSRGYYTIGIGHLIKNNEIYLRNKTLSYNEVITLFNDDIKYIEQYVTKITEGWNPTQNQFNVLCDFCFQYGTNLAKKYPNTYKAFLTGSIDTICKMLMQFTNADVKKNDGLLLARREKEIDLLRN